MPSPRDGRTRGAAFHVSIQEKPKACPPITIIETYYGVMQQNNHIKEKGTPVYRLKETAVNVFHHLRNVLTGKGLAQKSCSQKG